MTIYVLDLLIATNIFPLIQLIFQL